MKTLIRLSFCAMLAVSCFAVVGCGDAYTDETPTAASGDAASGDAEGAPADDAPTEEAGGL